MGKSIGKTVREVKRETGRPAPHIEQLESDLWWSIDPTACAPLLRCPSQGSWPSGPSSAASWLQELVADREGSQGTENRGGGWEIGCELGPLPSPFHDRCNLSLTYPPPPWRLHKSLAPPSSHSHIHFGVQRTNHFFLSPQNAPTDPLPHLRLARCVNRVTLSDPLPSASTRSLHCFEFSSPLTPPVPAHLPLTLKPPLFEFWFLPLFLPGGGAVSWLL